MNTRLAMMNTILDQKENEMQKFQNIVTQKEMSALMETASSWHSGQTSALYSLSSTEQVHTEEHREELLSVIESEIADLTADNFVKTETFSTDEIEALNKLRFFVKNYTIE